MSSAEKQRIYICVDLKSFYASVECVERGLDPMTTDLVVADPSRTSRTICLAITPHMKSLGVRNRCRLYEVPSNLTYIIAPPRMQLYIDYSTRIYGIYLKYAAKEDIYVYSIDEVFIDVTDYLGLRKNTPKEFAAMILADILSTTGITATCGIGTNMYLAKIALDIIAKHAPDYIGYLDEALFREKLWDHRPLSDFWRISTGTVRHLSRLGLCTMRDIAGADPDLLRREFGIDSELLIDHAWGRESVSIRDVNSYRPSTRSVTSGQVLHEGYGYDGAALLLAEMAELLSLELVSRNAMARGMSMELRCTVYGEMVRLSGSMTFDCPTCSTKKLMEYTALLYRRTAMQNAPVFGLRISFDNLTEFSHSQYDMFSTPEAADRELGLQKAVLDIRRKYGKSGILRGINLMEGAKTVERNSQIGGHRA